MPENRLKILHIIVQEIKHVLIYTHVMM